jgi:hypothetical protein
MICKIICTKYAKYAQNMQNMHNWQCAEYAK